MMLPAFVEAQKADEAQKVTKEVSVNGVNLVEALFCKIETSSTTKTNAGITPQIFYKGNKPITYGISLRIPDLWVHIEKGSPIIIKLTNGEIIEGKAFEEAKHDALDFRELGSEYYYKFSIIWYGFNKEDITKIRKTGLIKLRVSDGVKFYDYQILKTESKCLNDGYNFLEEHIKNKPTLYDGF